MKHKRYLINPFLPPTRKILTIPRLEYVLNKFYHRVNGKTEPTGHSKVVPGFEKVLISNQLLYEVLNSKVKSTHAVLTYILVNLRKDKDHIKFSINDVVNQINAYSRQAIYDGINELLRLDLIARSTNIHMHEYFVNTKKLYKGNVVELYNQINPTSTHCIHVNKIVR